MYKIFKLFMVSKPHHKNYNAILNYKNISLVDNIDEADVVYSPGSIVDTTKPVIYGPHFSVFPDSRMVQLANKNCVYIQPSQWVVDFWSKSTYCHNVKIEAVPFGVDTNKFSPNNDDTLKSNVLIYVKRRRPEEINFVVSYLRERNIPFRIFDYLLGYDEQDYLSYLKSCKFAIWLSAHESQGFALEEALSCGVPILVWNVRLLSQEYGSRYPDIKATTIPYWDDRCGEVFYIEEEMHEAFEKFIDRLDGYNPREFVMENLSMEKCEKKFLDVVRKILY
jgi:glycosyltransferase involved in cell wall biosynthesis